MVGRNRAEPGKHRTICSLLEKPQKQNQRRSLLELELNSVTALEVGHCTVLA